MPNDSKLNSTNTSNPSLSGTSSSKSNSAAVDWFKKKTGTAIKKVNRLEEKFNQAIGKAQRTEDELYESNVHTFEDQTQTATLFSKELNKYICSLKEAQKCQKSFNECLKQIYESSWPGYNELIQQCQKQEELWTHNIDLLQQCVQMPIQQYLKEFPETKKQIEKRDNKLLDYDKARHTLIDLESSKKQDEMRIHKARLDLQDKQRLFNDINTDLHIKLPKLYEERKGVYSKTFKSLFNVEKSFYNNMYESNQILSDLSDNLIEEFCLKDDDDDISRHKYNGNSNGNGDNGRSSSINDTNSVIENDEEKHDNGEEEGEEYDDEDKPSAYEFAVDTLNNNNNDNNQQHTNKPPIIQLKNTEINDIANKPQQQKSSLSSSSSTSSINSPKSQLKSQISNATPPLTDININSNSNSNNNNIPTYNTQLSQQNKNFEPLYSNMINDAINVNTIQMPIPFSPPVPEPSENKLPKILYKVKATYPYQAKEVDELTFSKEDLIDVIEGTESEKEDLDEGWLIGIHCQSKERGLFPENFTKRI